MQLITLTDTYTLGKTPLDEGSARLRPPVPDNTQKSQETDIHALGWIRSRNPSQRAATDSRLQPPGQPDRRMSFLGANTLFPVSPLLADILHFALLSKDTAEKGLIICIQCAAQISVVRLSDSYRRQKGERISSRCEKERKNE